MHYFKQIFDSVFQYDHKKMFLPLKKFPVHFLYFEWTDNIVAIILDAALDAEHRMHICNEPSFLKACAMLNVIYK